MPNNRQSRTLVLHCAAVICSAFIFLFTSCSHLPENEIYPTATIFMPVPLTSTEQVFSPTAPPQTITNTPSTENTISRIVSFGKFDSDVKKIVISSNGKLIGAVGGENDELKIWDIESGKELLTLKDSRNGWHFALSDDGHLLASTADGDSWITVRDIQTGQKLQRIKGIYFVQSLAFSPDGNILAIDGGSAIWLWDIQNNKLLDYLGPESDAIGVLVFSRDGKQLVSVGDYAAQLWDLSSKKATTTIRLSRYHLFWGASVSPENPDYLIIPYSEPDKDSLQIWDTKKGKLIQTITEFGGHGTPIAISPDGRYLAVTQTTNNQIWDISCGKSVYKFQDLWAIFAFSADGNRLAVGHMDGTIDLWDISQLK